MCKYSSTYFGSCHHCELYLLEFCDKAEGSGHANAAAAAAAPPQRNQTQQASLPYRLDSIAEEEEEAEEEMPGLAPFAAGFRQWMGSAAAESASGDSTPSSTGTITPTSFAVRQREEGIRGTDESSTIHNSNSIVQHITNSTRGFEARYTDNESISVPEYGTYPDSENTATEEDPRKYEELAAIEAEIDTLKEEVKHMREASQDQAATRGKEARLREMISRLPQPVTRAPNARENELPVLRMPQMPSNVGHASRDESSNPNEQEDEMDIVSPAKLLQRRHQQEAREEAERIPQPARLPSPPKMKDFPGLGASSGTSNSDTYATSSGLPQQANMRVSYARAASKAVMPAPKALATLAQRANGQQKTTSLLESASGQDAAHTTNKSSPRFAQATKATLRRADETLRNHSPPVKPGSEASPTRSGTARGSTFGTEKRIAQRGHKRTSLPQGWCGLSGPPSSPIEKSQEPIQPSSPLRKKTSSYMAPTMATQQRNIATLAQENAKRANVKSSPLTVDTSVIVRDFAILSSSSDDTIVGSDDLFFTAPNTRQNSESPQKRGSRSPTKSKYHTPAESVSPLVGPSPIVSHASLPIPRHHVPNTIGRQQTIGSAMLEPIVKRLLEQELYKSQSQPQASSGQDVRRRGQVSRLQTLTAKLENARPARGHPNRIMDEAIKRALQGSRASSSSSRRPVSSILPSPVMHARPASRQSNTSNSPISQIISGLRGRSSVDIGKALLTPSIDGQQSRQSSIASYHAPADPAILYQGNMPAGGIAPPQLDPAIIFSGSMRDAPPTAIPRELSRTVASSLRATAQEFTPRWETPSSEVMPVPSPDPTLTGVRIAPSEWKAMSIRQQKSVMTGLYNQEDVAADRLFLDQLQAKAEAYPPPRKDSAVTSYAEMFDKQAAQLQQAASGSPIDMSLGTPAISPHSMDTSPPESQGSQQQNQNQNYWKITADSYRNRPYTWTGSDGLEIRYHGYGPDAERDPNSPVVYRNANTQTFHRQAGRFSGVTGGTEDGSPAPPDAPRRMREWAKQRGYPMVPCGDVDYVGMHQAHPFPNVESGLCHGCKGNLDASAGVAGGMSVSMPVQ